jgi:hypothetical protein
MNIPGLLDRGKEWILEMDKRNGFFIFGLLTLFLLISNCGGGGGGGGSSPPPADTSGSIELAWDASPDPAVTGYMVYYGTRSGIYENYRDTGSVSSNSVSFNLTGLAKGQTYYIVVTAYDTYRDESDFSNEVRGAAK